MNFAPSTIWTGDNFYIMRGMDSAMVNLIYLDTSIRVSHEWCRGGGSLRW